MCGPAALPIAMIASAAIAGGASIYSASKTASAQKDAANTAAQQAQKQAAADKAANDRAINAANRKQGNFADMFSQNLAAGLGGVGSTLLTGAGGAPPANTLLGRSTLLGG